MVCILLAIVLQWLHHCAQSSCLYRAELINWGSTFPACVFFKILLSLLLHSSKCTNLLGRHAEITCSASHSAAFGELELAGDVLGHGRSLWSRSWLNGKFLLCFIISTRRKEGTVGQWVDFYCILVGSSSDSSSWHYGSAAQGKSTGCLLTSGQRSRLTEKSAPSFCCGCPWGLQFWSQGATCSGSWIWSCHCL